MTPTWSFYLLNFSLIVSYLFRITTVYRNRSKLIVRLSISFKLMFCLHHRIIGYQVFGVLTRNEEGLLTKRLLDQYRRGGSKYARPVTNPNDILEVTHGLSLQSINSLDTHSNRAVLTVWENYVSIYFQSSFNLYSIILFPNVSRVRCCKIKWALSRNHCFSTLLKRRNHF